MVKFENATNLKDFRQMVDKGRKKKDMKEIRCTIWKLGNRLCRITVNDIRYRKLDTACISDIDILFKCMEEIKDILDKEYLK